MRKDLRNKLEQIQYNAIRAVLGLRKTTPTNILLAESKLPFIYERSKFLCNMFLIKTLSNESLPLHKAINIHCKNKNNINRKRKRLFEICAIEIMRNFPNLYKSNKYCLYQLNYDITTASIPIDMLTGTKIHTSQALKNKLKQLSSAENLYLIYTKTKRKPIRI